MYVCLVVCDVETSKFNPPRLDLVCCATEKNDMFMKSVLTCFDKVLGKFYTGVYKLLR
jgi:hypothetical protein